MNENSFSHQLDPQKWSIAQLLQQLEPTVISQQCQKEIEEMDSHLLHTAENLSIPDLGKKSMVLQLNEEAQYLIANANLSALPVESDDISLETSGCSVSCLFRSGAIVGGGGETQTVRRTSSTSTEWTSFQSKYSQFLAVISPIAQDICQAEMGSKPSSSSSNMGSNYTRFQGKMACDIHDMTPDDAGDDDPALAMKGSVSYIVPLHRVLIHIWQHPTAARLWYHQWCKVWKVLAEYRLQAIAAPVSVLLCSEGTMVSATWLPPVTRECLSIPRSAGGGVVGLHVLQERQLRMLMQPPEGAMQRRDSRTGDDDDQSAAIFSSYDGRCYILQLSPYLLKRTPQKEEDVALLSGSPTFFSHYYDYSRLELSTHYQFWLTSKKEKNPEDDDEGDEGKSGLEYFTRRIVVPKLVRSVLVILERKLQDALNSEGAVSIAASILSPTNFSLVRTEFRKCGVKFHHLFLVHQQLKDELEFARIKSELASRELLIEAFYLVLEAQMISRSLKCLARALYEVQRIASFDLKRKESALGGPPEAIKGGKNAQLTEIINAMAKLLIVQKDSKFCDLILLPFLRRKYQTQFFTKESADTTTKKEFSIDYKNFPSGLLIRALAGTMVLEYNPKESRFVRLVTPSQPQEFGFGLHCVTPPLWISGEDVTHSNSSSSSSLFLSRSYQLCAISAGKLPSAASGIASRLSALMNCFSQSKQLVASKEKEASMTFHYGSIQLHRVCWEAILTLATHGLKGDASHAVPKEVLQQFKLWRIDEQTDYVNLMSSLLSKQQQKSSSGVIDAHFFAQAFAAIWLTTTPLAELSVLLSGYEALLATPYGHFMLMKPFQMSFSRAPPAFATAYKDASASPAAKELSQKTFARIFKCQWKILERYANVATIGLLSKQTQSLLQQLINTKSQKIARFTAYTLFEGLVRTRGLPHGETGEALTLILNLTADASGKKVLSTQLADIKADRQITPQQLTLFVKYVIAARKKAVEKGSSQEKGGDVKPELLVVLDPNSSASVTEEDEIDLLTPVDYYTNILQVMRTAEDSANVAQLIDEVLKAIEQKRKQREEILAAFQKQTSDMVVQETELREKEILQLGESEWEKLMEHHVKEMNRIDQEGQHIRERKEVEKNETSSRREIAEKDFSAHYLQLSAIEKMERKILLLLAQDEPQARKKITEDLEVSERNRISARHREETCGIEKAAVEKVMVEENLERKDLVEHEESNEWEEWIMKLFLVEKAMLILIMDDEPKERTRMEEEEIKIWKQNIEGGAEHNLSDVFQDLQERVFQEEAKQRQTRQELAQSSEREVIYRLCLVGGELILLQEPEEVQKRKQIEKQENEKWTKEVLEAAEKDETLIHEVLAQQAEAEERDVFCQLEEIMREEQLEDEREDFLVLNAEKKLEMVLIEFSSETEPEVRKRKWITKEEKERSSIEELFSMELNFVKELERTRKQKKERATLEEESLFERREIQSEEEQFREKIEQLFHNTMYLEMSEISSRQMIVDEEMQKRKHLLKKYDKATELEWAMELERQRLEAERKRIEEVYQQTRNEALLREKLDVMFAKNQDRNTLPTTGIRKSIIEKEDVIRWLRTAEECRPTQPLTVTVAEFKLKQPISVLQRWMESAPLWEKAISKKLPSWVGKKGGGQKDPNNRHSHCCQQQQPPILAPLSTSASMMVHQHDNNHPNSPLTSSSPSPYRTRSISPLRPGANEEGAHQQGTWYRSGGTGILGAKKLTPIQQEELSHRIRTSTSNAEGKSSSQNVNNNLSSSKSLHRYTRNDDDDEDDDEEELPSATQKTTSQKYSARYPLLPSLSRERSVTPPSPKEHRQSQINISPEVSPQPTLHPYNNEKRRKNETEELHGYKQSRASSLRRRMQQEAEFSMDRKGKKQRDYMTTTTRKESSTEGLGAFATSTEEGENNSSTIVRMSPPPPPPPTNKTFVWVQLIRDLASCRPVWQPFKLLQSYTSSSTNVVQLLMDVDDLVHAVKTEIEVNTGSGKKMNVNALCMEVGIKPERGQMEEGEEKEVDGSEVLVVAVPRDTELKVNTRNTAYYVALNVDI